MAFQCPQCLSSGLEIFQSIALPPDSRSDEIFLQVIGCSGCGFSGLAVYEESRRGALDAEAWDHSGYRVAAETLASVQQAITGCPDPSNPACTCPAHRVFGRQAAGGRWEGIARLRPESTFPIQTAPE